MGLEEIPAATDDSSARVALVVEENELVVLDDTGGGNASFDIPVDVGVADTSLCATGIEVLEDMVGVVPFDAGEAEVDVSLVTVPTGAADVVAAMAGGVEEVVISGSGSGVISIKVVRAAIEVEKTETATLGEVPCTSAPEAVL